MSNLLRELDHGPAALPRNSEVVMFNRLETEQQQAMLSVRARLRLTFSATFYWEQMRGKLVVGLAMLLMPASFLHTAVLMP
jgi:hypothetical protein